jgi:TonB family protein
VVPPVLAILAPTVYPDGKRPKSQMVVVVEVLVDEFGKVLTAKAVSGGGLFRRYRDPAVETAKKSLFRPAVKNGVTGRMWTEMRIVFEAE